MSGGWEVHRVIKGCGCELCENNQPAAPSPALTREARKTLEILRDRHANIEGDDPVAVKYGIEPHRQRMCANDRQVWPCDTVEAIDIALSAIGTPPPAGLDLLREIWLQWPTTLPEELLLRVERALGHHPLSKIPSPTEEEPA